MTNRSIHGFLAERLLEGGWFGAEERARIDLARAEVAAAAYLRSKLYHHPEMGHGANAVRAWLAVVAGNARARAFYRRRGWADEGPFEHRAPGGFTVPCHRYAKPL